MKKILLVLLFSYSVIGLSSEQEYVDIKYQHVEFKAFDIVSGLNTATKMCTSKGYDTALFLKSTNNKCALYGDGLFGSTNCQVYETKKRYVCLDEV